MNKYYFFLRFWLLDFDLWQFSDTSFYFYKTPYPYLPRFVLRVPSLVFLFRYDFTRHRISMMLFVKLSSLVTYVKVLVFLYSVLYFFVYAILFCLSDFKCFSITPHFFKILCVSFIFFILVVTPRTHILLETFFSPVRLRYFIWVGKWFVSTKSLKNDLNCLHFFFSRLRYKNMYCFEHYLLVLYLLAYVVISGIIIDCRPYLAVIVDGLRLSISK